jgi:hypothetical protein
MIVRKLGHRVQSLEKVEKLKNVGGLKTTNLYKSEKLMKLSEQLLIEVFRAEKDNHSEKHSKASFLLCQLENFIFLHYSRLINHIFSYWIKKNTKQARYCWWTLKYSIAIQERSLTFWLIREQELLTLSCENTIISYTETTCTKSVQLE